ncbi:MAG: hypothetical protein HQ521_10305 [Bacteroidetes bacterium]|nr:hypothetical protein [Bacteroidota bacterium]
MGKKILLIVDNKIPELGSGKILQKKMLSFHGLGFYYYLAERLDSEGIDYITLDLYKNRVREYNDYKRFVISYECSHKDISYYKKNKIVMFMSYSGESPINSLKYHKNINKISAHFHCIYGFIGVSKLLINKSNFRTFYWPMNIKYYSKKKFEDRFLLAYIASAKSKFPYSPRYRFTYYYRKPRYYVNWLIKKRYLGYGKDISNYRFEYIRKLATSKEFYLFGKGWTKVLKEDRFFKSIEFANIPEEVDDKGCKLQNFKFTLCFENTLFPGYITEKIFDAMLAGSVPVYVGCNNITQEVPSECFINVNDFSSPESLLEYLRSMDKNDWELIYSRIIAYIVSEEFKNKYSAKLFAEELYCELKKII